MDICIFVSSYNNISAGLYLLSPVLKCTGRNNFTCLVRNYFFSNNDVNFYLNKSYLMIKVIRQYLY